MKSNLKLSFNIYFILLFFQPLNIVAQLPLTPPAQDYALSFYGNEMAVAPPGGKLNLGESFTMETWIFLNDSASAGVILGRVLDPCGVDPVANYTLEKSDNSTLILFSQSTGQPGSRRSILSSRYLKLRTWNHIAATLGNSTMKLFINGEEVGSQISPGLPKIVTVPFAVGGIACTNSWGGGFSGSLREVRIWDHALTASELISQAGIALSGTEHGLIANWRLDEGYGQIAHDRSPNKYDLQVGFKERQASTPVWIQLNILENDPYYNIKIFPTTAITDLSHIALIDFDNDKNLDVISAQGTNVDWSPNPIVALKNDGSGNFAEVTSSAIIPKIPQVIGVSTMIVRDFNNDNRSDLYIGDLGPDTWPTPGGQSQLLLQSTDRKMINVTATHMPQITGFNHSSSSGDIDNDGDIDIYNGACNAPRIYVNDGTGHFASDSLRLPPDISAAKKISIDAQACFDADGDGDNDLILGPAQGQHIARYILLKNDGKGYFSYTNNPLAMPLRYGSPEWYNVNFATVDINGDGWNDFISPLVSEDFKSTGIQLVLSNGDGTFRDATYQLPSQDWPAGGFDIITPCDINGDGLIDFVCSTNLMTPQIFLNRGNAVFANATEFITRVFKGSSSCPTIPGDVNKDGRIDLVLNRGRELLVLENIKNISLNDLILPTITKLSSESGADGETIKISGTNFTGTTEVHFGQKPATFEVLSDSEINAIVPKFARNGLITITTPKAAVVSATSFSVPASTVNILLSNTKIPELAGLGSSVGAFSTEDPGEIYSHTYSFATGNGANDSDNAKFRIAGDTLKTNAILHPDLQSEYHINLKYSDLAGGQGTKQFVITTEGDGLVAYYPFNGNTKDESGNNHHGTPTNVTLNDDQFGNPNSSYSFNGINSKIEIGNHLGLIQSSPGLTITAWVYPEELNDGQQYTVIAEREGAQNYQFVLINKRIYFTYWSGGNEFSFASDNDLDTNKWYFITVTYDGTAVKLYQDGSLNSSFMSTGQIDNDPSTLLIGQIYNNDADFKGKLDEISIYNKALSPERIKSLYNCAPAHGGKVGGGLAICPLTTTGVLTLSGNEGNVMEWQKKSGTGSWVSIPSTDLTYSEIPGLSGSYYYRTVTQYGTCDIQYSGPDTVNVLAISDNKQLNVKVFLEGLFAGETGLMKTTLNDNGSIPTYQPYNVAPWNYFGSETVSSVPAGVVDWVLVELRQAANPTAALPETKLAGWPRAYFLRSDGTIVDLDGSSLPTIGNPAISGNLYAIVRHRNHIAIMSSVGLTPDCVCYPYNFSDGLSKAHGNSSGYRQIVNGVFGMVSGDANSNGDISVLDFTKWATDFGRSNIYLTSDINGDGQVSVLDFTKWATNFGMTDISPLKGLILQKNQVQPPFRYKTQVPGEY